MLFYDVMSNEGIKERINIMSFIDGIRRGVDFSKERIANFENGLIEDREPGRLLAAKVATIAFGCLIVATVTAPVVVLTSLLFLCVGDVGAMGFGLALTGSGLYSLASLVARAALGIFRPSIYFGRQDGGHGGGGDNEVPVDVRGGQPDIHHGPQWGHDEELRGGQGGRPEQPRGGQRGEPVASVDLGAHVVSLSHIRQLLNDADRLLTTHQQDYSFEDRPVYFNAREAFKHRCSAIFERTVDDRRDLGDHVYPIDHTELDIYRTKYRKLLFTLSDIYAGNGSRVVDDDEKRITLQGLAEAFVHCTSGLGGSLQQLVLYANEPRDYLAKVDHWINIVKREVVDQMAMDASRNENRNIANRILEAICDDINLPREVDRTDRFGYVPANAITKFYEKFTKDRVYNALLTTLNDDNRDLERRNLISIISNMFIDDDTDNEETKEIKKERRKQYGLPEDCDEDADGNEYDIIVEVAKKFETKVPRNGGYKFHLNREAIKLLAKTELSRMKRNGVRAFPDEGPTTVAAAVAGDPDWWEAAMRGELRIGRDGFPILPVS